MDGISGYHTNLDKKTEVFSSSPAAIPLQIIYDKETFIVRYISGLDRSTWKFDITVNPPLLTCEDISPEIGELATIDVLAILETIFNSYPHHSIINVLVNDPQKTLLLKTGIAQTSKNSEQLTVYASQLWQEKRLWLSADSYQAYPLHYVITNEKRHPLRPPKPNGIVYSREIPWLKSTLSFRTIDIDRDVTLLNQWMNEPTVAYAWQEEGDIAKHHSYLEKLASDPHTLTLFSCLDGKPFGYFEVYWAKEDRIAPFYDVNDFDRGWHVLIGDPAYRGKSYVTAWLPSISHYLFLDDCRTQRVVIEPRVDNLKMRRNLSLCGYADIKEFNFPHKRAMLGMLLRERFFEERLWIPRA